MVVSVVEFLIGLFLELVVVTVVELLERIESMWYKVKLFDFRLANELMELADSFVGFVVECVDGVDKMVDMVVG